MGEKSFRCRLFPPPPPPRPPRRRSGPPFVPLPKKEWKKTVMPLLSPYVGRYVKTFPSSFFHLLRFLLLTLLLLIIIIMRLPSCHSGAGRSSEVERSLMVRWAVGSILQGLDPLSYFSFQPVLHDWCNKGRSLCGGSGFPFSLSEWS